MKKHGEAFTFEAIGHVRTPFADKFGIPRQPGLASLAKGVVKLLPDPDLRTALKKSGRVQSFVDRFCFSRTWWKKLEAEHSSSPFGGNRKVGVLASRSPHRPNPIGISVVTIEKIDLEAVGGPEIHVGGVDLLDGTPILDIKPYIPYADSVPSANAGWASAEIPRYDVGIF